MIVVDDPFAFLANLQRQADDAQSSGHDHYLVELEAHLDRTFAYHTPDTDRSVVHQHVRSALYAAALSVVKVIPNNTYEQVMALEKMQEAMFWANAGVARADGSWTDEALYRIGAKERPAATPDDKMCGCGGKHLA